LSNFPFVIPSSLVFALVRLAQSVLLIAHSFELIDHQSSVISHQPSTPPIHHQFSLSLSSLFSFSFSSLLFRFFFFTQSTFFIYFCLLPFVASFSINNRLKASFLSFPFVFSLFSFSCAASNAPSNSTQLSVLIVNVCCSSGVVSCYLPIMGVYAPVHPLSTLRIPLIAFRFYSLLHYRIKITYINIRLKFALTLPLAFVFAWTV